MLIQALNLEVEDYINQHLKEVDESGNRLVVRNGRGRPRKVTIGSGTIEVPAPRVDDKREGKKFSSFILPPYYFCPVSNYARRTNLPISAIYCAQNGFNFFDWSKNQFRIIPDFSTTTRFSETTI
jgi:hypothetical protein